MWIYICLLSLFVINRDEINCSAYDKVDCYTSCTRLSILSFARTRVFAFVALHTFYTAVLTIQRDRLTRCIMSRCVSRSDVAEILSILTLGFFMFLNNTTLMVVAVLGIIATLIGMGFRDKNPGIILMGIGFLATLFAIIQKAIKTFS